MAEEVRELVVQVSQKGGEERKLAADSLAAICDLLNSGGFEQVCGKDEAEVHGFVPTRQELIILLEHRTRMMLDHDWNCALTMVTVDCLGLTYYRYLRLRMRRIGELLGGQRTKQVVTRIMEEFVREKKAEGHPDDTMEYFSILAESLETDEFWK